jgi:hypothetical protein
VDLIDVEVAFDCDDTHRLPGCDFTIFVVDSPKKLIFFALEAAFVGAVSCCFPRVAAAGAGEGCGEVGQEQDGQVGLQALAEELVELKDDLRA